GSDYRTLRAIYRASIDYNIPPLLVVIGILELDFEDPRHIKLLNQLPRSPPFKKASIEGMYIGGGGFSACSFPRAMVERKRNRPYFFIEKEADYTIVNIVAPYDDGGSSKRDQTVIKDMYNFYIPSPGDFMSILAWATVQSPNWFNLGQAIGDYKPESREAIMNLVYVGRKRITAKLGKTLEETIEERIIDIRDDETLSWPAYELFFIANMFSATRILQDKVINRGYYLDYLWSKEVSLQNLVKLAAVISTGFDLNRTLELLHHVYGLRESYCLPASTDEA
ncbi:unnamed protein product, partial [marine sediment metagenome]